MRIPDRLIYHLELARGETAYEKMKKLYKEFKNHGTGRTVSLKKDLLDYAKHGFIKVSPTAMALAKPCRDEEGDYWFIRAAVGPIDELLRMLPCDLPRIMWCRRNEPTLRLYKTERLYKIAAAQLNKKKRG